MKKIIVILLAVFIFTGCGAPKYKQSVFFDNDYLKKMEIEQLPVPQGDALGARAIGFNRPYIFVDKVPDIKEYAQEVLDYLKGQNFKYIYTAEEVAHHFGIIPAIEDTYIVKDFTELEECLFHNGADNFYIFIYGNDDSTTASNDGRTLLNNSNVIKIFDENSYIEDTDENVFFDYCMKMTVYQEKYNSIAK